MKLPRISIAVILQLSLLLSATSHALELKGITLPETIKAEQDALVLNGAGTRSKFVFDIYVGALYLVKKSTSAQAIINDPGAKLVSMYFVYDEISAEKMTNGWNEGFGKVLNETEREMLAPQITAFNNAFSKTVAGDVIVVGYSPVNGTKITINNELKATIPGFEFHQALMKIWLGDDPVDDDLKQGMLGKAKAD